MKQRLISVSDSEIEEYYNEGKNLSETAVLLNMTVVSLWRRAKAIGLAWSKNKNIKEDRHQVKHFLLSEILTGKHPYYQTFKLKNRLIKDGIKENKCEKCGITKWNDNILNMQLDHKDGNPHNHLLDNLQMLCPNCHAQTENYCGKNKVSSIL